MSTETPSPHTTTSDLTYESACSERRLAANRANAQLSTGPRTANGKAVSSLNAVKTGLCGRAVLLAGEEEARAYREHVERVVAWWTPDNVEEHALVQSLADTQWRIESIPGLESALYAQARLKGTPVLQHPDPTIQRLLLDGQAEVAEARALKNLRLHERSLRRQFEQDKAELNALRKERFEQEARERKAEQARLQEKARREREEAERQGREEQARLRRERRQARQAVQTAETAVQPVLLDTNGFELTNWETPGQPEQEQPSNYSESPDSVS
jgi:ketosteroid isomerase-like protein